MKLIELQQQIAAILNADETLSQGGCKAFAEDALDFEAEAARHLHEAGSVAIAVLTPSVSRGGGFCADGIPVAVDELVVEAAELPGVNRAHEGALTALAAAQRAALVLDSQTIEFHGIRQNADAATGTLTASVSFSTNIMLTN